VADCNALENWGPPPSKKAKQRDTLPASTVEDKNKKIDATTRRNLTFWKEREHSLDRKINSPKKEWNKCTGQSGSQRITTKDVPVHKGKKKSGDNRKDRVKGLREMGRMDLPCNWGHWVNSRWH